MSEFKQVSSNIMQLLNQISHLNKSNYTKVEKLFTKDFCYTGKNEIKNPIYYFLDRLNNNEYRYELEKIKELSETVFLVYLKCINMKVEKTYHHNFSIQSTSILIIKKIDTQYCISEVIEFKREELYSIHSVFENFS